MKTINFACVLLLAAFAVSCGGGNGSSKSTSPQASLQGSWEVVLPNVNSAGQTGFIEVNFTQAGSSVTTSQVEAFFLDKNNSPSSGYFYCYPTNTQSASATLTGNSVSGTLTTCMGTASFTGTMNGNSIYGAYTGTSTGDAFNGSGSFTASTVPSLSGTYAGPLTFTDGTAENVSLSLCQNASTVAATGSVSGPDAGSISLSGYAVANTVVGQGTVSGESWTVFGWYQVGQLHVIVQENGFPHYLGGLIKQ